MQTRLPTGVHGLDEMLRGGFLPGSVILVRGAPGTGKTCLSFQFLVTGAQRGEKGVFITFEEFPQTLYRDANAFGHDLQALEREDRLRIIFTSPRVFLESLQDPDSAIHQLLTAPDVRRAVLDSATHFNRLTYSRTELRQIYATVANSLRREQITALLLSEEQRSEYHRADRGGLSFLADGILLLRYVEVESAIQRALVVLKLRGSDHAREIRHYEITAQGIQVGPIFQGREALLSGISHRT